ncbi:hypothetical protein, partial [Oscillatoria sp. HE19RPO]|uniref:hypothetical protein n=1 Tax=Oscillatoria sp. HE19RPO TaxID=2954806 RepID=UPI0020C1E6B0
KDDRRLEQTDRQGVEPAKSLPPMISLPLEQINTTEKITGGGNLTPRASVQYPNLTKRLNYA